MTISESSNDDGTQHSRGSVVSEAVTIADNKEQLVVAESISVEKKHQSIGKLDLSELKNLSSAQIDKFFPQTLRGTHTVSKPGKRTPNSVPHSLHSNLSLSRLPCSQSQECSQSQTTEILTQNQELTQLADDLDDNGCFLSPLPPYSPGALRRSPWGQLLPCSSSQPRIDLLPRDPIHSSKVVSNPECGISILGLENIKPSDIFSEYSIGRSSKCDLCIAKPSSEMIDQVGQKLNWAYNLVSNRHCKIFCMLQAKSSNSSMIGIDVYIEDDSANGTLINKTIVLQRREKRLLHTGDEISLVNPQSLQKRVPSNVEMILQQFSFIFVNSAKLASNHRLPIQPNSMNTLLKSHTGSSKRKAAVDVKSTRHPRCNRYAKPSPTGDLGLFPIPVPRSANHFKKARLSPGPAGPITRQQCNIRRVQEDYDIRDMLGSGTVGTVHRAIHRRTGFEYAIKIIQLSRNRSNFSALGHNNINDYAMAARQFQAEALILESLEHPYIVKLIDVYVSPGVAVYLVMELLPGGDLFDRIVAKGQYSETESRRVMRRLLSAIYYLHQERNIVHRDLKPENILCVSQTSDIEVKITDFGLAKALGGSDDGLKTFCGTPQYFAPEVLKRRHTVSGRGRYGKQADMWSLGVVLYILLSGTPPFDAGLNEEADRGAIDFPEEFWSDISDDAKDLILKLLVVDPQHRMTVHEACQHKWILVPDGDTHAHPLDDPQLLLSKKRLFCSVGFPNLTKLSNAEFVSHVVEAKTESKPLDSDGIDNVNQAEMKISEQSVAHCESNLGVTETSNLQNIEPLPSELSNAIGAATVKTNIKLQSPHDADSKLLVVEDQENGTTALNENIQVGSESKSIRRPLQLVLADANSFDQKCTDLIQSHKLSAKEKPDCKAAQRDASTPKTVCNEMYNTPLHGTATKHLFEKEFRLYGNNLAPEMSYTKTALEEKKEGSSLAAKEVTPGISNIRNPLPKLVSRQPIIAGLELSQDEIISHFSDKTESISSFSTIPVVDASDGEVDVGQCYKPLTGQIEPERVRKTRRKAKISCVISNQPVASKAKDQKNVRKRKTSAKELQEVEASEHPSGETAATKQNRKPGRKQTTLSGWVKLASKHAIRESNVTKQN